MTETNNNQGLVRLFSNAPSIVGVKLGDYRNLSTERVWIIRPETGFTPIPLEHAISMFLYPSTLKQYNDGLWSFNKEDKEHVMQAAKDAGFYYENDWGTDMMEQPEVMFTEKEVKTFLRMGRTKEIELMINEGSSFQKMMLVSVAKSVADELNGKMIRLIEDSFKIGIVEVEE